MKPFARSSSMPLLGVAVLLLAACSGNNDQAVDSPTKADEAPAAAAAPEQPASPWNGTANITPVYPDQAASKEMKLDYESFQFEENGLSVAPLPPFFGRTVDVELKDSASKYTLTAGRAGCAYKVKVTVGSGEPKLLDPKQGEKLEIDSAAFAGAQTVTLHVALEDGAEQNWSCNLHIAAHS